MGNPRWQGWRGFFFASNRIWNMSDMETLENSLMAEIASAADEQAIEAVR
ncbi:MAG: phenylalanine--tRNA ligase subunit alpha, partial [Mesorhizobium sp.]